jgi:hypothetical protein
MLHHGIELSSDAAFRSRVVRLIGVSSVALGLIWLLWERTLETAGWVGLALAVGWFLMPALLALSLRWPLLRYGLVAPATLVSLGLLAIIFRSLPDDRLAATGWVLLTAGVLLGGTLGMWFWFRMAPVPDVLDRPFGRGRWVLVAAHNALIVAGAVMIAVAADW